MANAHVASTPLFALLGGLLLLLLLLPGSTHAESCLGGYEYSSGGAVNSAPSWMSGVCGSRRISELSIPGTHDTMASQSATELITGCGLGLGAQTQAMTLEQQLQSGIRVLDIRMVHIDNGITIHHGPCYLHANLDDVLGTIGAFLQANGEEAVFARMRFPEYEGSNKDNTRSFEATFQTYAEKYKAFIHKGEEANPLLEEVRGKLVIWQNFDAKGVDGKPFGPTYASGWSVQDYYNPPAYTDLYDKWSKVKAQLNEAMHGDTRTVTLNYLSAGTSALSDGTGLGVTPFFAASGKVLPCTCCDQLFAILQPEGNWPDFPHSLCILGGCTITYLGTNILAAKYIGEHPGKRTGILYIDFPDKTLIKNIINANPVGCSSSSTPSSNSGGGAPPSPPRPPPASASPRSPAASPVLPAVKRVHYAAQLAPWVSRRPTAGRAGPSGTANVIVFDGQYAELSWSLKNMKDAYAGGIQVFLGNKATQLVTAFNLTVPASGSLSGSTLFSPAQDNVTAVLENVAAFLAAGQAYFNVASSEYPGGAIAGVFKKINPKP